MGCMVTYWLLAIFNSLSLIIVHAHDLLDRKLIRQPLHSFICIILVAHGYHVC